MTPPEPVKEGERERVTAILKNMLIAYDEEMHGHTIAKDCLYEAAAEYHASLILATPPTDEETE